MNLRIAMVGACPFPAPQGSQVFLRETALALQRRGHEVHLVVYGHGAGPDPADLRVHRGIRLPGVSKTAPGPSPAKPILDAALVGTLLRVLREHSIDLVHAHNYEGLMVALAAGKRPIVYHAHNAMSDELPYFFWNSGAARRVGSWLDRTFPRKANYVIALHERLAEYLIKCGCDPERTSVVTPPVDAAAFELGAQKDEMPFVLYTGNLDAYQNLPFLFRFMARIRKTHPQVRLVIATAQRARYSDAEVFPTPTFASVREILSKDCVVVCPRVGWSGYPIKLLNAMAAGRPIVACRSSAYPLTQEHDGFVVEDYDEAGFAEAIARLLDDAELRRTFGQRARETALQRHGPDVAAAVLEAVYFKLLGKGTP